MDAANRSVPDGDERGRRACPDVGVTIDNVESWAIRFALLGDVNRLRILLVLHRAPGTTVGNVAAAVGMSDNAASHALAALHLAGVVAVKRDGRYRRWSVVAPAVRDLLRVVGAGESATRS